MRLYRIKYHIESVVYAPHIIHAEALAYKARIDDAAALQETEFEPNTIEIYNINHLPKGWAGNCLPWGGTRILNIKEILEQKDRELRDV